MGYVLPEAVEVMLLKPHCLNTLCAGKYEDLKQLNIQFQVNIAFKQN